MSDEKQEDMVACFYRKFGGPEVDQVGRLPRPQASSLQDGQVLIKVHASSLNPADYKHRGGGLKMLLSIPLPAVYGFDFSGVVLTSRFAGFKEGDQVFGMCRGLKKGGLAEYMVVDGDICCRKPEMVTHQQAASVCLVGITAILGFRKCGLKPNPAKGPRVLITGGAGGVGSVAIQLAKGLYDASYVVTTASAGDKTDFCKSLGADRVIDYRTEDVAKVLATEKESEKFDCIFDCTDECSKLPALLKRGGGLVSILGSPTTEGIREWLEGQGKISVTFGVQGFLQSRLGGNVVDLATGAYRMKHRCYGRFYHVIGTGNGEIMQVLADEMTRGRLKACIDKVYRLSDSLEAIKYIEGGRAKGKVVIDCVVQEPISSS